MKRFIVLLSAIFICVIARADTENIAWYVDDNLYTITQCESGDDISLPSNPTKTGYNFIGWREETVMRGIYTNWSQVPTTATYRTDAASDAYPKYHDRIVVLDAGDWANPNSYVTIQIVQMDCHISFDGNALEPFRCGTHSTEVPEMTVGDTVKIKYKKIGSGGNHVISTAGTPVRYNGVTYPGDYGIIGSFPYSSGFGTLTFVSPEYLVGEQEFIYEGDWATDGKNGWVPISTPLTE